MCEKELQQNISSTGSGTRAMIIKKYASLFFIITSLWFIYAAMKFTVSGFRIMSEMVASPWNFGLIVIFVVSGFVSCLHDFAEMLQDYIRSHKRRFLIMFFVYAIAIFGVLTLLVSVIHFHIFMQIANNL